MIPQAPDLLELVDAAGTTAASNVSAWLHAPRTISYTVPTFYYLVSSVADVLVIVIWFGLAALFWRLLRRRGDLPPSLVWTVPAVFALASISRIASLATSFSSRSAPTLIAAKALLVVCVMVAVWSALRHRHFLLSFRSPKQQKETQIYFATVAHDLRNPVGSISMAADVMLHDGPTPAMLNIVAMNAKIALRLIGDLIDAEAIATGKLTVAKAPCRGNDVLDEALASNKLGAVAKAITLDVTRCDPDPALDADCDRLAQALGNLLANAVKFTPRGGTVAVKAWAATGLAFYEVRDTGPGITDGARKRIFHRFAQGDSHGNGGLGLGLYIARAIVEQHGGTLDLIETSSAGSTFTMCLPCTSPSPPR